MKHSLSLLLILCLLLCGCYSNRTTTKTATDLSQSDSVSVVISKQNTDSFIADSRSQFFSDSSTLSETIVNEFFDTSGRVAHRQTIVRNLLNIKTAFLSDSSILITSKSDSSVANTYTRKKTHIVSTTETKTSNVQRYITKSLFLLLLIVLVIAYIYNCTH